MTRIRPVTTNVDIISTWPVMSQLRPHIAEAEYLSFVQGVLAGGGEMIAAFDGDTCTGCSIFREQLRLATGPMIYVDDLVTDAAQRSTGVGAALLAAIEEIARERGIPVLTLDSGTHRERAHAFYFREGFTITSFNFKKRLT